MTRLWPRSLFGRLALILFVGLAVAHGLTFWLVMQERGQTSWLMMMSYLAKDIATSVAILDRLPADERAAWLDRLERRNYSYAIGAKPDGAPADDATAQQVVQAVATALGPGYTVSATQATDGASLLRLHLALTDHTPLTITLSAPAMAISAWVFAVLALQLALLAAATWFAVRLATRPLAQLARASDRLGPALQGPLLPEDGPREVARAATAFNAMQRRIAGHLGERMRILAAVSHDLQTPITRMRLRAELLDSTELRDKLNADLDVMQTLVREGIAYARSAHGEAERPCRVDLDALLDSLACDYRDAGQTIRVRGRIDHPVLTRPQAVRRIVVNLLDNALKFARDVEIHIEQTPRDIIAVTVCDRGPGIDPAELAAVLQPFYRLDRSRNRDTGGTGLGLAIASELALLLGGRLTLANRDGGGLAARFTLPAFERNA
ncbi:MAG TPA: HAMP domain-containing sensor histidine kinase [Vineibacter sp.]|nr:HAMP domain-containing sensor histidine kinase [Vineibacter sp.]